MPERSQEWNEVGNYSNKDFTNRDLREVEDINGQTITGSCFSQERPNTHVFPFDMKGVTFINCNLDNCFIPAGNTVQGGSQRRFRAQDDGFDWLIDESGLPLMRIG